MIKKFFYKTKKFCKEHKEQIGTGLLIVGAGVCAFALGYSIGSVSKGKNVEMQLDAIRAKKTFDAEILLKPAESVVKEVKVPGYIRSLPEGYHASFEKIAEATEKGIELMENQTLVNSYNYNRTYIA